MEESDSESDNLLSIQEKSRSGLREHSQSPHSPNQNPIHWDNEQFYHERSASAPLTGNSPLRLTDDLPVFTSLNTLADDDNGKIVNVYGDYVAFYDSIRSDASRKSVCDQVKVYRRRWYVLFVFFWLSFMQGALVDVYQVRSSCWSVGNI